MQVGAQNIVKKKIEPAVAFLNQSVSLGIPANTVIFIDTHSCASTGALQYGGGRDNAKVVALNEVCDFCLFDEINYELLMSYFSLLTNLLETSS
jgi:hypothetical protein